MKNEGASSPVERALWFVENRLEGEISLQSIAESVGVTEHHLARAFGVVTGQSLMRYVRGRRLTEAARSLAAGEPDIFKVALEAGYGSHEAFTRAFREHFQVTPEQSCSAASLNQVKLVEPLRVDRSMFIQLDEPRFEENAGLLIAGLSSRYTFETNEGIPRQWQRFAPYIGNFHGQIGSETYGVAYNLGDSGNFDYLAGVRVSQFAALPEGFTTVRTRRQRYAVFRHSQHVSMLRRTHYTIWTAWLPNSGKVIADAPNFERYGKEFDPVSGTGPIEIWMPISEAINGQRKRC